MGAISTAIASPKAQKRAAQQRSPDNGEWDIVDLTNRRTLARHAGAVWIVEQCLQPLSTLEAGRDLGSRAGRTPIDGRSAGRIGLGAPFRGRQHCSRSSACRRGKKSTPAEEALGRSQGGLSTKIHLRCDGQGRPITFLLTPGQQHELSVAEQLMEQGGVRRASGHIRLRPKRVSGDKGYSSRKYRHYLRKRGVRTTIPRKKNEHRSGPFNRELYRQRNQVERLINRLKQFRRVATRYEKRASCYAAMLTIAMIFLWL